MEYPFTMEVKQPLMSGSVVSYDVAGLQVGLEDSTLEWRVMQRKNNELLPLLTQIDIDGGTKVYWRLADACSKGEKLDFVLKKIVKTKENQVISYVDNGKDITFLSESGQGIFTYRYTDMPVPEGVSQVFSRSGFVHPLKTLQGNVVTRIQPSDHYHHYGLWGPWVQTEYRGEEIDFWNLSRELGTVRHSEIVSISTGPLFQELKVLLHHIIHPGRGEEVVMQELRTYRIWLSAGEKSTWFLDAESQYNMQGSDPLTIKEYRYQGFSFRGPQHWNDEDVTVITSQGKNKSDGNATRARWIQVAGPGDVSGQASIVTMTYPSNFNYPELLRIWPTGTNNSKGNVFVNFNPTQDRDWIFYPGQTYTLRYRIVLSDQTWTTDQLNQWHDNYIQKNYQILR
ncbi:hypothetical protein GCM10025777_15140 [Membranihabitans marinus]